MSNGHRRWRNIRGVRSNRSSVQTFGRGNRLAPCRTGNFRPMQHRCGQRLLPTSRLLRGESRPGGRSRLSSSDRPTVGNSWAGTFRRGKQERGSANLFKNGFGCPDAASAWSPLISSWWPPKRGYNVATLPAHLTRHHHRRSTSRS